MGMQLAALVQRQTTTSSHLLSNSETSGSSRVAEEPAWFGNGPLVARCFGGEVKRARHLQGPFADVEGRWVSMI